MKTVLIELPDEHHALIQCLKPELTVAEIVAQLLDHVQQGIYRPGSWERRWLCHVFFEADWVNNLEPGDPYGRSDCAHLFVRPKAKAKAPPSYTCPVCQRTSYNPHDVANKYCGACHQFEQL